MELKLWTIGGITLGVVWLVAIKWFGWQPTESVRDAYDGLMVFMLAVIAIRDWKKAA